MRTSIWKTPIEGTVRVRTLNVDGDQQSDLSVHGGSEKAVYVYPVEHYAFWRRELPEMEFPLGAFGENFTTEGLLERDLVIGDRLVAGTSEFLVTQPRMPCFKLAIRFNRDDMIRRFLHSGRTGFYLAVLREGEVAAGAPVEVSAHDERGVSVAEIVALYSRDSENQELLRRAVGVAALPEGWRDYFRKRLWNADE